MLALLNFRTSMQQTEAWMLHFDGSKTFNIRHCGISQGYGPLLGAPRARSFNFGARYKRSIENCLPSLFFAVFLFCGFFLDNLMAQSEEDRSASGASAIPIPAEVFYELKQDMSFYDVVRLLGAPLEKKESETKREDVWLYPEQKVFFHEGKVVAWTSLQPVKVELMDGREGELENTSNDGTITVFPRERKADAQGVEKILDELMEQSGEAGFSESATPGLANPPHPPNLRNPNMEIPRP